jgi:hypothetical protein
MSVHADSSLLFLADLRRALAREGCPLCLLRRQADERYLRSLLREGAMDAGLLDRLLLSGGFCREHAWALQRLEEREEHDALTTVIIMQPLLEDALRGTVSLGEGKVAKKRRERSRAAMCPACHSRSRLETIFAEELSRALVLDDIAGLFRSRRQGLCLQHFRSAWHGAVSPEAQALLRDVQLTQMKRLRDDLAEYVRKHKHQFRDEPRGEEQGSATRGVEMLSGLPDAGSLPPQA